MLKNFYLITLGLFLSLTISNAQYGYYDDPDERFGKKDPEYSRWFFGGDFWLSFGSVTYINIEPIVGYRVTPRFSVGTGPMYSYEYYKNYDLERSFYGGRTIAQYALIPDLSEYLNITSLKVVLQTEYEVMNIKPLFEDINGVFYKAQNRYLIHNWLIGGGISQPLGKRSNITITLMYDLTAHPYSPYQNPILNIGFGI